MSATVVDTTFVTMDHMMAAVEMQLAGEPLAETMGRQLSGYSRDFVPPNVYFDPSPTATGAWVDLVGFATAVESYEYSKQPMNNVNFESGAGVSLLFGPVINPNGLTGKDALALAAAAETHYAELANATGLASWNKSLPGKPPNVLGWPGFWPIMQPYKQFDPTIHPTNAVDWLCSIASDDTPGAMAQTLNEDYECDYSTLNLPNRSNQVEFSLTPGASGWAGWKSALWVMNYLQIMHDSQGNSIASVPQAQLAQVGTPGNMIMGTPSTEGVQSAPGVYLGSSTIEGFQAANMIAELDNGAQQWISSLTTTDGTTLTGFASLMDATRYDFSAPLRWMPKEIAVTEDSTDASGFPRPAGYQIKDASSSLLELDGLLGAYSTTYALTDRNNSGVGGSQPVEVYFDGDPFPQDDQLPDGEATLHDRSAALIRLLVVSLDRLHRDPSSGVLVDDVTFDHGTPSRSTTVSTTSTAYTLVALRNARRALNSFLQLYSNTTPDTAVSSSPLDAFPLQAPDGLSFTQHLTAMISAEGKLLLNQLTTADGHAYDGWNLATGAPVDSSDTLDAHTAAIRGLLTAYLSTGDERYRQRAIAVFRRMDSVFYDRSARIYTVTPAPNDVVPYTPRRFGLLEGALRDLYELVGSQPGQAAFAQLLEHRLTRLIKLVLNGWDDRNQNQVVDYPQECVHVENGLPRGGLQMAERALSGELGSKNDDLNAASMRVVTVDRDSDCVPDIAAANLPSALANEVDFTVGKP